MIITTTTTPVITKIKIKYEKRIQTHLKQIPKEKLFYFHSWQMKCLGRNREIFIMLTFMNISKRLIMTKIFVVVVVDENAVLLS